MPTHPLSGTRADIVLVTANARYMHPALGLRCLMANLGPLESRTTLKEYVLKTPPGEAAAEVAGLAPRILGISVAIWNQAWTMEFLHALKGLRPGTREVESAGGLPGMVDHGSVREGLYGMPDGRQGLEGAAGSLDPDPVHPGPLIVLGGPQVWFADPVNAALVAQAHVVVQGAGETAFARLAGEWLADSRGFLDRHPEIREGRPLFVQGGRREFAGLARPYRFYSAEDLAHGRFVYVESSRGCPHSCTFCMSSLEKDLEFAPLEEFLADLEDLLARGGRRFKMLDRTFNAHIPRAVAILHWFRTHLPQGAFVQVELEPGRFPQELKDELAAFPPGMLRLEIGIQTLNPAVAGLIKRPLDPERELANLAWLRDHTHATVHADLIAGLPGEDMRSFAAGFDRLWETRPGEIQLGMLKRLPGTALSRPDPAWGMEWHDSPPWQIRKTAALGEVEVTELARFAKYWELIVNRDHFESLVRQLLPPGEPAFTRFRTLAQAAWAQFGRTHSIDRKDLESFLAGRLQVRQGDFQAESFTGK